ncbi:MAG: hypothetical protein MI702_13820, partial [Chlorobiales bacterium]|nr:hypothetical protein [Chlorobiales bacterium]
LPGEVVDWWGETWVPKLVEAGLKAIVTVVPSNAIAHMSTDSWQTKVTGGITQKNVKTLEEAHALVHQLRLEEFQL